MNAHSEIHHAPCAPQVRADLFFGRSVPNGRFEIIDAHSFQTFLEESVTPHFPGFTVQEVVGYWKGQRELAYVLTLLSEDSDAFRAQVRIIAEHYKARFNQEAVAYSFTACQFTLNCWPYGPVAKYHQLDKGTAA